MSDEESEAEEAQASLRDGIGKARKLVEESRRRLRGLSDDPDGGERPEEPGSPDSL